MAALFAYTLTSGIYLLAGYLIYKWLLSTENQPAFNRSILLALYVLALAVLPAALHLDFRAPVAGGTVEPGTHGMVGVVSEPEPRQPLWPQVALAVYAAGALITLVVTLVDAMRLSLIIARGSHSRVGRVTLVTVDRPVAPFSWGRYVVVSRADTLDEESLHLILVHESGHADCRHWADLMLAQAVCVLMWYNPASWLMREELKSVHEYQADRRVLATAGVDARSYQMLLVKKAVGIRFQSLANSLNHSKLKKRITMMYSKQPVMARRLRALAIVPALAAALAVTNLPAVASVADAVGSVRLSERNADAGAVGEVIAAKVSENSENTQSAAPVPAADKATPDKLGTRPEYPGGEAALYRYVGENLCYPEAAVKANAQGKVVVEFTILPDGTTDRVRVVRGVYPDLDKEAVRVVRTIKGWKPGTVDGKAVSVVYTMPVNFKLEGDTTKAEAAPVAANDRTTAKTVGSTAMCDVKPVYPGGEGALFHDLATLMKYPPEAEAEGIEGRVVVEFTITADGSVDNVRVMRGVHPVLDKEAVRVVKELKRWTPGKVDGKPVSVTYTLPMSFRLPSDDKSASDK